MVDWRAGWCYWHSPQGVFTSCLYFMRYLHSLVHSTWLLSLCINKNKETQLKLRVGNCLTVILSLSINFTTVLKFLKFFKIASTLKPIPPCWHLLEIIATSKKWQHYFRPTHLEYIIQTGVKYVFSLLGLLFVIGITECSVL